MNGVYNNNVVDAAHQFTNGEPERVHVDMEKGPEGLGPILERSRIVSAGVAFAVEAVRAERPDLARESPTATTAGQIAQVVKMSIEPDEATTLSDPIVQDLAALGYQQDDGDDAPDMIGDRVA